ncbi:Protein sickie [Orchesella cincta]|uniref:Protein sickie n=1 Tax=Orchesella cincta TaxID=48709 RepID=A0A1D2N434_ORCCI|nr:Protein sickie [Orchesella cincta]
MTYCIRSKRKGDSNEDFYSIVHHEPQYDDYPQSIVQIYTDWANHYLEKARCKRQIQDLQVDVTDGVILADVIEAVTSQKVPDVHRKPKTSSQMRNSGSQSVGRYISKQSQSVSAACDDDEARASHGASFLAKNLRFCTNSSQSVLGAVFANISSTIVAVF